MDRKNSVYACAAMRIGNHRTVLAAPTMAPTAAASRSANQLIHQGDREATKKQVSEFQDDHQRPPAAADLNRKRPTAMRIALAIWHKTR